MILVKLCKLNDLRLKTYDYINKTGSFKFEPVLSFLWGDLLEEQNKVRERCGAKTRAGGGHPCKLTAGYGTNHLGTGRCKFHGGASTGSKSAKKNKNAEKHGLFTKHLPEDAMEIFNEISEFSAIDMLWDNIKIQYTAIIRAQKIMFVKNKDDLVQEIKTYKESPNGSIIEEYELQFAWDRYDKYMSSQARAMTNLTNMIVKYEELCKSELVTEEQILRIEKLKRDLEGNESAESKLKDYFEKINEIISD